MGRQAAKQAEKEVQAGMHGAYAKRYHGADALAYQNYWSDKLLSALDLQPSLRILDCGCGQGIFMQRASAKGAIAFGADLSLDLLRHNPFQGRLVQADMEALPFRPGSFDAIFVRGALHHLPSLGKALDEITETVKGGGVLVVSEPNHDSLLLRLPRFLWYRFSSKFSHSHRAIASREILEAFRERGYTIRKVSWFGFLAFPLCGLKDFLPILDLLPFKLTLTKGLIALDEFLSRIPLLRRQSWHVVVEAVKEASGHQR